MNCRNRYIYLAVLILTSIMPLCSKVDKPIKKQYSGSATTTLGLPDAVPLKMDVLGYVIDEYDTILDNEDYLWVCLKSLTSPFDSTSFFRLSSFFFAYKKRSNQWFQVKVSTFQYTVCFVKSDPFDTNLIWFGCNDGLKESHYDGRPGKTPPSTIGENALRHSVVRPGGLAVIDTKRMQISYFGWKILISQRVYTVIFDQFDPNYVWIWGKYPLANGEDGITKYDRESRNFTRHIHGTKVYNRDTGEADHAAFEMLLSRPIQWDIYSILTVNNTYVEISSEDTVFYLNKVTGQYETK